jgi:hypothetical protein
MPRERAVCFGMTELDADATHWRCAETMEGCEADLALFMRDYPNDRFGGCEPFALFPSLPVRASRY